MKKIILFMIVGMLLLVGSAAAIGTTNINPKPAYANDNLNCEYALAETYTVVWTNDKGVSINGNPLSASATKAGDRWTCTVYEVGSNWPDGIDSVVVLADGEVNNPPVFDAIADVVVNKSDKVKFTVHAVDPDGDLIKEYGILGLPESASFNKGTGLFEWTPKNPGIYNPTFAAEDEKGSVSYKNVLIRVKNTSVSDDNAPFVMLTIPSNGAVFEEGKAIHFAGWASDREDGLIQGEWFSSLDGSLGKGNVLDKKLSLGYHIITFKAKDSAGVESLDTIMLRVDPESINNPPAAYIDAPLNGASEKEHETVILKGRGLDSEDGVLPDDVMQWTSDKDGFLGYGSTLTKVLSKGKHTITLKVTDSKGISRSTSVHVTVYALNHVDVTPLESSMKVGDKQTFKANAYFGDGSSIDVTNRARWITSNGKVLTINESTVTAVGVGFSSVIATYYKSGIATVNVEEAAVTVQSVEVTPAKKTLTVGDTYQFYAFGDFSDGLRRHITTSANWSSDNESVATVNDSGFVTTLSAGTAHITAEFDGVNGSATLTVNEKAVLNGIRVVPSSLEVDVGSSKQLALKASYSDGSELYVTSDAVWTSDNPSVALVDNAANKGKVTGVSKGTTSIKAFFGGFEAEASVSVTDNRPKIVSLDVSPDNAEIKVGGRLSFTATANYDDGSSSDATSVVEWSSSDSNVAAISNDGNALGISEGTVKIKAVLGNLSDETTLNVKKREANLVSVDTTPDTSSARVGDTIIFTLIGTYDDGSTADLSTMAVWTSDNEEVAVMEGNVARVVGVGTANIEGSYEGLSDRSVITSTPSLDTDNPAVNIISPNNEETVNSDSVDVVFTVSDASDIVNCNIKVDNDGRLLIGSVDRNVEVKNTLSSLSEGEHLISVECTDRFGNVGSDSADINVNLVSNLSVNIVNPEPKTYEQLVLPLDIESSDSDALITFKVLDKDGVAIPDGSGNTVFTYTGPDVLVFQNDGTYTLTVSASLNGEVVSDSVVFNIDTGELVDLKAPVISLIAPADGTVVYDNPVRFVYRFKDDNVVVSCEPFVDNMSIGATNYNLEEGIGFFDRNLDEGTHTWSVECTDGVNKKSASGVFTVEKADNDSKVEVMPVSTGLFVGSVSYNEVADAGREFPVSVHVKNTGEKDLNSLGLTVFIQDLGIVERTRFDVKKGDSRTKTLYLNIPRGVSGYYDIRIDLGNDDVRRRVYRTVRFRS